MKYTILNVAQRSDEWKQARAGRLTASRAADMLATAKSGEAAARRNLRMQLVLERGCGKPMESGYFGKAMQQGIEREPDALALYEALTGELLTPTGFLRADDLIAGASLDGAIMDGSRIRWIVECKSPLPATHWEYLKTGAVPKDYLAQITHQLWVSGADGAHWLSYCPDFPEPLQTKMVEVQRLESAIEAYDREARAFLAEVEREVQAVQEMAGV